MICVRDVLRGFVVGDLFFDVDAFGIVVGLYLGTEIGRGVYLEILYMYR